MGEKVKGCLLSACLLLLSGCGFGFFERSYMRTFTEPLKNQIIEVESGDRFFVELEENMTTGYQWEAESQEDDGRNTVELEVKHLPPEESEEGLCGAPGMARIRVRIHRGFLGPATVILRYRRPWERRAIREISLFLWKRDGDVAPWRD